MEINSQINTFNSGMNLDTDITMLPSSAYRLAENVRILTDDAGTTGILLNIEDIRQYQGGLDPSEIILGTAVSRRYNSIKSNIEECAVVITKELYEGNLINNLWIVTDFDSIIPTWELIVSALLGLREKVAIVTNFESNNVSNVYISDGLTAIKCINIQKEYNTSKINPIEDSTYFDIISGVTIAPFQFVEYTSGNLPAGCVLYCYQLFNLHGSESTTSSLSGIIPIINSNGASSKTTKGELQGDVTDKGCLIKATLFNDDKFDKIRIISVQYSANSQIPRIFILNELDLPESSDSTITFTYNDTGTNRVTELSIEEFNDLIPYEFNAKSITKLHNRLFASNIQEITWDVTYDARAYRSNSNGNVLLISFNNDNIVESLENILSNETDVWIPETHDCINPTNNNIIYDDIYVYGSDTLYRGGSGLNVSYRFVITDLIESDATPVLASDGKYYSTYNLEFNSVKQTYSSIKLRCPETGQTLYEYNTDSVARIRNYSDPYYVSNFLSYLRDEIYRFGIVFYNKKNIPSPVHWIGDIRFPSADTEGYEPFTFNSTVDGVGRYELVSHPLGILFTVNNLPLDVVAYEIVRCDRTLSDRTVVTQGLLNKTVKFNGWDSNAESYDSTVSLGSIDRRPTTIPSYTAGTKIQIAQGYYTGADEEPLQFDSLKFQWVDSSGVFDFISSDVCFNKERSEQIVSKDMKIVPIYCAHSGTYDGNNYRIGVPFTTILNGEKEMEDGTSNPFGCIITHERHTGNGSGFLYGFFDGYEEDGKYEFGPDSVGDDSPTGGVCKYYKFFSKSYADGSTIIGGLPNRIINIQDVVKTSNISPYMDKLDDIKANVNYVGTYAYVNYSMGSYLAYGPHGVNMAIYAPDMYSNFYNGIPNTPDGILYSFNAVLFVNIKKNAAQYGGDTFISRSASTYISTNTFVKSDYQGYSPVCFGGDTYLGIFDYAHTLLFSRNDAESWDGKKRYVSLFIPLESSVNLYYRADAHFNSDSHGMSANIYYMTEPGALNTKYVQKTPMYAYNSAYSCSATAKNYVLKSIYAEDNAYNANRITCSEVKTINENIDSWTKFKFANYIDTDSAYGLITNLKVFKDKLYFFQDSSVGVASVNDRSLIADNNPGSLVLGTGGVLTRYDYLITLNGSSIINDKSITNSETTLYWHDYDKNVLCALANNFLELSKTKHVQTYLNRLPDSARRNPVSFYDKKYNEVWFRIYDRCLIYNELLNVFTSFYTHNPNWFFPFSTKVITVKDNNCYYLHNMHQIDTDVSEERISKVEFVINKDFAYTKVFDNQWFTAEFEDTGDEERPTLITNISFSTKTQRTAPIDYNSIEVREDNYRFSIGREQQHNLELLELTNMSYAGRMRGKYLICNYTFDCNDNREFKLPYIKTTYRYSML